MAEIGATMPRTRASPTASIRAVSTGLAATVAAVAAPAFPLLSLRVTLAKDQHMVIKIAGPKALRKIFLSYAHIVAKSLKARGEIF